VADPVLLEVWSDFLCPWCYVGAIRIKDLQQHYGEQILVTWKSYLLRPKARAKSVDQFRDYTRRWVHTAGPGAVEPRAVYNVWANESPPTHSVPSAIAGKVALSFGPDAFDTFHMALMRAYFTDTRDISDKEVILDVAQQCGLDAGKFDALLTSEGARLQQLVFEEMAEGVELGVHAAPTVLLNGALPIPGAQDLSTYTAMIDRIIARSTSD
jgi:predicted DsbA family dithiol-disulfide isomerase